VELELLVGVLGLAAGCLFLLTFGGRTYLQLSPLVLHREQSFSYASLVQHILRFRHASQLGKLVSVRGIIGGFDLRSLFPGLVFSSYVCLSLHCCVRSLCFRHALKSQSIGWAATLKTVESRQTSQRIALCQICQTK
jgi:hypothetical protein